MVSIFLGKIIFQTQQNSQAAAAERRIYKNCREYAVSQICKYYLDRF